MYGRTNPKDMAQKNAHLNTCILLIHPLNLSSKNTNDRSREKRLGNPTQEKFSPTECCAWYRKGGHLTEIGEIDNSKEINAITAKFCLC